MPIPLLRFSASLLMLFFSGVAIAEKYVVTNNADSGAGTLRQAIIDANATPKKDRIVFDFPGMPPHVILLTTPLPEITESVTIAGSGSVVIDGSGIVGPADGLRIVDANESSISGLTIRDFTDPLPCSPLGVCSSGSGISIQGSSSKNKLSHNQLLGNVNGIVIANGASGNLANYNFIDGEVGAIEPQGGDPLTDVAFRTDLRVVNGFPSYGIVVGPGAPNNKLLNNHTQRTFRGIVVLLSDQNKLSHNSALTHGNQCYLVVGSDNLVTENACELARREAFEIFGGLIGLPVSSRNRFADNYASRSGYGDPGIGQLLIQGGTENVFEDNTLLDNFSYGIALFGPTSGNVVRSTEINGLDNAGVLALGFPGLEIADNVLMDNSLRNYSRTGGEGAIVVVGNANFNLFFDNFIGVPGGPSLSAVQVQGAFGIPATNNRFEENIHERTGVLWFFDSGTQNNTVCGPELINTVLDVASQLITPPGIGNEVFEECDEGEDEDED